GIDRNDESLIIIGAIPVALLAIIFDVVLPINQDLSYRKIIITLRNILLLILLITLVPLYAEKIASLTIPVILVTEPFIINQMYKILIEEETDYSVRVEDGRGKTSFLFNALESGDIDGYLEFTGTVLGELTKEPLESKDESDVYEQAKSSLEGQFDMT